MKILVINAGSSSLKYQLIDADDEQVLAKGQVERIGIPGTALNQKVGEKSYRLSQDMGNHVEAIGAVLAALTDPEKGAVSSMDEIAAVGHRVVHGGEKFSQSVLIDDEVMEAIQENVPLAPLHNPANIMGIDACRKVMPGTPMVAVFDTAFHQTMPDHAYLYALPYEYYTRLKVRRYGFHGTSHRYVSSKVPALLDRPAEDLKFVVCHLGNGSSLSAIKGGKSVDTSMGLTPLEGVPMGTRSGDLDPAILEYVMEREELDINGMMAVLNKKSGVFGLSGGRSSDMRDLTTAAAEGSTSATRALQVFYYRVRKYIGAYAAAMGGLDAIVFTAGIGENDHIARANIIDGLGFLGAHIEESKNFKGAVGDISTPESTVKVFVVPTDEEMAIARDTKALVEGR